MKAKKQNSKMTVKKVRKYARASPKYIASAKKKIGNKMESNNKVKNGNTLLIAQEVKFAQLLANNDKHVRDKVLKNLKKWLTVRSQSSFAFTEEDFFRLWKGLFYCMWMSDKPLVQEDLAESISKLVHCFHFMEPALLYTKCTLISLSNEWFGIDQYRLDKFHMLVRKIIRQTFVMCKNQSWNKQWVVGVAKVIEDFLLDPKICLGLSLHITDLYMEELAKISEGNISPDMVTELIRPFVIHLVSMDDQRQMKHVIKNIFRYLILQSDVGMDYTEKFNAWRNAGFPCQSIDEMQKTEISDGEEENENEQNEEDNEVFKPREKPLDPRAGRVDVQIPQILFDAAGIAKILKENKFHKLSTTMTRKQVTRLINDFTKLHKGDMPFGIKEIPIANATRVNSYEAAENLLSFEDEIYKDSVKRRRKNNGDLLEDSLDQNQNSLSSEDEDVPKSKAKKQKVSNIVISGNIEIQSKKVDKKKKSKKLKKLNISESLPIKKVKKSSKMLNKTFTKSTIKSKNNLTSFVKLGTSSNWSVDENTPATASTASKKGLAIKKTPQKNKATSEKPDCANIPWLTPVLTRLEDQITTPTKSILKQTSESGSVKKKVKIMLQKNMSQNTSEYIRQILKSPAIPYDANRKPKAGVLKPSPLPSLINPFYKNKNR
ncbi:ribosomal RNA processing protein 1 homolog [Phymastichus coffea]|uniref:ribosomal RNA processing protein 1 homolog n=1 Tax=Phymastichus coffea TaxID=108790 RepID=UPI00273C5597|nr:ribosomal RNA processing protein 1 homolog [Phymastichus coffea]